MSTVNTQTAERPTGMVRIICEGAMCIAAAQVLSLLPLWKMTWGGSVDLAMLPIILFAVRWGIIWGFGSSLIFGFLQFALEGGIAIGWQSVVGDFFIAYAALGVAGIFRGKKHGIFYGTILACFMRFMVHYVVGATIWASYMPEEFFGMTMTTPWFYSALYNGSYMLLSMLLILLISALSYKPLKKFMIN